MSFILNDSIKKRNLSELTQESPQSSDILK